jgi:hypothetical protein
MSDKSEKTREQEPIGIVISRGTRAEATPRLLAYVWGQADDAVVVTEPTGVRAA